jgi:prepilin-type N-terminal cleavage/methylation domain-containing protein
VLLATNNVMLRVHRQMAFWHVKRGFSLVEIAVSLAVLAVALTAILGLLSVGLRQAAGQKPGRMAMDVLARMESAIRAQRKGPATGEFSFAKWFPAASGGLLAWKVGGEAVTGELLLGASGEVLPESALDEARFRLRYEIKPAAQEPAMVRALLSVAWPARATWSEGWTGEEGALETVVVAVPRS